MEEIRCPNCGAVLICDEVYEELRGNGYYHTECCCCQCSNCKKEYKIYLHYKYANYSIEEEK